ncbi:hypothetical protein [Pseudomonas poae]|uniref:hypothetical protein n=1 Tax=Pseudomonas poae TaxID=200451 RepID=UPI0030DF2667
MYTLVGESLRYWKSVMSQCAIALVLGALAAGVLWLDRLESKFKAPIQKRLGNTPRPLVVFLREMVVFEA